jgi:sporulation protein YlmC with PRC-barrel domain
MKNKLTLQLIAGALVSAIGLMSYAQSGNSEAGAGKSATSATQNSAAQTRPPDLRATELIGTAVRNAQDENVGNIEDLIVDPVSQRVHYAVLSFGGFLGMGDKLFAFPVNLFTAGKKQSELVLNLEKDKLKNAPGFDRNHWPDLNDNRYRGDVDRYHKSESADRGAFKAQLARATELIGRDVKDGGGNDAGKIEDLVINIGNGQVRYAVLELNKAWGQEGRMVALPVKALNFPRDKDKDLVMTVPKERIDMSRSFDEKTWPELNNAQYLADQENYLSTFDTGKGVGLKAGDADRKTSSGASGSGAESQPSIRTRGAEDGGSAAK